MFRNGWARLWAVLSAFALAVAVGWAAYYVWVVPPCYQFVSITPAKNLSAQNQALIGSIKDQAIGKQVCSSSMVDPLLTIEELAKQRSITQVGIEWRGPKGWSMPAQSSLDVLDGKEITARTITTDMARYVASVRLPYAGLRVGVVAIISVLLLVLGLGAAWIRRGFRPSNA